MYSQITSVWREHLLPLKKKKEKERICSSLIPTDQSHYFVGVVGCNISLYALHIDEGEYRAVLVRLEPWDPASTRVAGLQCSQLPVTSGCLGLPPFDCGHPSYSCSDACAQISPRCMALGFRYSWGLPIARLSLICIHLPPATLLPPRSALDRQNRILKRKKKKSIYISIYLLLYLTQTFDCTLFTYFWI